MRKEFGGLGIPNLQDINLCLLGSWIKRYYEGEGKPQRAIIDSKYVQGKPKLFFLCHNTQTFVFWKGIQPIIQALKFAYRCKIEKGDKVRFWEDTWFGTSPLVVQLWPVYLICNEQTKCISEVWDGNTLKLSFRRIFSDRLMEYWYQLLEIARSIKLSEDSDSLVFFFSRNEQEFCLCIKKKRTDQFIRKTGQKPIQQNTHRPRGCVPNEPTTLSPKRPEWPHYHKTRRRCSGLQASARHTHIGPEAAFHTRRRLCHPRGQIRHSTTPGCSSEPPLRLTHRLRGRAPSEPTTLPPTRPEPTLYDIDLRSRRSDFLTDPEVAHTPGRLLCRPRDQNRHTTTPISGAAAPTSSPTPRSRTLLTDDEAAEPPKSPRTDKGPDLQGVAPKREAMRTPPTPAPTKVETWVFTRKARD